MFWLNGACRKVMRGFGKEVRVRLIHLLIIPTDHCV